MFDESDEPLFTQRGLDFVPTEHTRGPWDPRHQHGGAVAALVARAAEQTAGPGFAVTRLTMELMRPVPLETLAVDVAVPRSGQVPELGDGDILTYTSREGDFVSSAVVHPRGAERN